MNSLKNDHRSLVEELDLIAKLNKELNVQIEAFCVELKDAAIWARNFRRNLERGSQ